MNTVKEGEKKKEKQVAVLALTQGGMDRGRALAEVLGGEFFPCRGRLSTVLPEVWKTYRNIVCFMAAGIVVRSIAPLLQDKYHDPAVVVCDEQGRFAISLISGHLGGANTLAGKVAEWLGGTAVITTASDVLGRTALDLWCRDQGLYVDPATPLTPKMGKLVDHGTVQVYCDCNTALPDLPADLVLTDERENADLIISSRIYAHPKNAVRLYPQSLAVGIGCKRECSTEVIKNAVFAACASHNLAVQSIAVLASITLKKDESGLLAFAEELHRPLVFFTSDELNRVQGVCSSPTVFKVTGAKAVAEPAALLAANAKHAKHLLVQKQKGPGVTVAIAALV